MWLPLTLLLLCLPGCLALGGSSFVTGITGRSLTIRCWYDEGYRGYNKYWCRGQHDTDCDNIVETQGKETEERNGRVSIRDEADDLTLTVTIRNLNAADAGTYWCKIQTVFIWDSWSRDPSFQVQVSVAPAPPPTTTQTTTQTTMQATPPFLMVTSGQNFTNQCFLTAQGCPLSIAHLLFMIFLKLPLFLSILGAILCVNRRQRGPGGRQSQPDQGNPPCRSPAPVTTCPGIQSFTLDKRDLQTLYSRARRQ
ncbi:CMRF35-like molecule 2 [Saccopteryx leptura]|uniref:CMRF35-like molecule 2 n=1 Tax=Saccopteryx leptura TaxID=249018 RepID=UPI00339C474C